MTSDRQAQGQERATQTVSRPRAGSVIWVLLIALALIGAATAFMVLGRQHAQPYIMALLALLSMVGLFGLLALASGLLRLGEGGSEDPVIRSLVEYAADGLVVTDAHGHVVQANAAYLTLTGARSLAEARPIERVYAGDPDVSEALYRLVKAAREGKRLQEEVRIANRGEGQWLRIRVRPLGPGRTEARHAVWAIADITRDRVRQENAFQELRHAIDYLDHAPAGFFSATADGAIVYLNVTLANWLDYDLAQIGAGELKLADIISGDGAELLAAMTPQPGAVTVEVFDVDLRMRGGKTIPARLYHKVAFGADGQPGASRTLVLNRAREAKGDPQRAAEVRFMRFFNNTPMAIATIDEAGNIVLANARFAKLTRVLGGANEAAAEMRADDRSIFATVRERDRRELEAVIRRALAGQADVAPVEAMLAGPGDRWGQFFVVPIDAAERETEAAIVYLLDTTEKRTLENQFAQSQKMQAVGQLAGGIAHDFNNVLSAIMMATDFLLNAHKPTDPSFQDIMQIKQNTNRAASLVRQLLAFSRRQTLRPQVLDLGDTLSDLSMLLRRLIGEKVRLDVVHARDLWPVKVDLSQFEQVIVNLAVNARDAMPEGGKLTVRTANIDAGDSQLAGRKGMPVGDYVLVEVTDTGTGIPPDIIDKVFEPFFSTKEVGKGTGLGLSTVYGIVKQTGGFIYIDSAPGKGTAFQIFLPRHVPDETAREAESATAAGVAAAPQPPARAPDLTGQGTILLVEDEDGLRSLNARGLKSRGYTVVEAANGVDALAELDARAGAVDLVVSDVVMPEMDGPTLLKEMRRRNPDLKIIFVSGYAEDAFAKSLPEGEQFAFLPKPFTLSQLVAAVKETVAKGG